jgi:CheY-like chemotaxis protein
LDEAIRTLEQQPVDVVVTARALPPDGSSALCAILQSRSNWNQIPVLLVTESAEELRAFESRASGFQDCQMKFDHLAVLESVAKLSLLKTKSEAAPEFVREKR